MTTDCVSCINALVTVTPTAAAAVISGVVRHANDRMCELLGLSHSRITGVSPGSMLPGMGLERLVSEALARREARHVERQVQLGNRAAALWVGVTPVGTATDGAALLTVYDTSAQLRGQIALLQQMRKVRTDNMWILDEDLRPVYADVDPVMQAQSEEPDFTAYDVIALESHADARRALEKAKSLPGETVETILRSRRPGLRKSTVYVDIVFFHDAFAGGHFFCCTRRRELQSAGVIDRLREAYEALTDLELAAELQISPSSISRAKNGTVPPAWIISAWQQKGVSADWLLTGRGEKY